MDPERTSITIDQTSYKQEGGRIREIIKDLEARSDRSAVNVESIYEQLKKANGGVEYLDGGEVFEPKPGDQYWLDDPDKRLSRVGIKLRQAPQMFGSTYDGYVFDWTRVEITGEPIPEVDERFRVNTVWYPVRVVGILPEFVSDATAAEGATGFVEKKWLGDKALKAASE